MYVALLLAGALSLHVEGARGVTAEEARAVAAALAEAVAGRTGAMPDVDILEGCDRPGCRERSLARRPGEDVLFVNLTGAPSRVRVVVERVGPAGAVKVQADLSREEGWSKALEGLALILFPEERRGIPPAVAPAPAAPPLTPPQEVEPSAGPWPWIILGAGAAATLAGVVLGLDARSARDQLEHQPADPPEQASLRDRAVTGAVAANVSFGLALAAGITGVLWLVE